MQPAYHEPLKITTILGVSSAVLWSGTGLSFSLLTKELGCDCQIGRIDDVVFFAYPEFDLYMLVYACTLRGEPRAVEVAELAWVVPAKLGGYGRPLRATHPI